MSRDLSYIYDNLPAISKTINYYETRERLELLDQPSSQKALDNFNDLISCTNDVYVFTMPTIVSGSKHYVIVDTQATYNPQECVLEKDKARKAF